MAGSYSHVVDEQGRLLQDEQICGMLECHSGDVAEAVEEMYGMIWVLAQEVANDREIDSNSPHSAKDVVEEARQNYREGLAVSPGRRPNSLSDDE